MGSCASAPIEQPPGGVAPRAEADPRVDEVLVRIAELKALQQLSPHRAVDATAQLIRANAEKASHAAAASAIHEPAPALQPSAVVATPHLNGTGSPKQPFERESAPEWLQPLIQSALLSLQRRAVVSPQVQLALPKQNAQVTLKKEGRPMTFAPALSGRVEANTVLRVGGLVSSTRDESGYKYAYYQVSGVDLQHLPGYCASLPLSESFDLGKVFRVAGGLLHSVLELVYTYHRLADFATWQHPQRYEDFFALSRERNSGWAGLLDSTFALPLPALSHTWRTDETWASQFLQGTNPVLIRLVDNVQFALPSAVGAQAGGMPEGFNLSADFRDRVESMTGLSLQALIAARRLFAVDHKMLINCPHMPGRVLYAPISLFYVTGSGTLLPLCIQLRRDGNDAQVNGALPATAPPSALDDRTVYYPDESVRWQLAKMLVAQADANHHEAVTHLGLTHLLMEPIIIAAHREFKPDHPMYRFLAPHLHRTLWINGRGRVTLIDTNDPKSRFSFNDVSTVGVQGALHLINQAYQEFDFMRDCCLPRALQHRGVYVEGAEQRAQPLPKGYFYRDYGLKVWRCMEDYVKAVVDVVYVDDDAVAQDSELQQFVLVALREGRVRGFPDRVDTRAVATQLFTAILWTCSAQHAAVNFPQYDYYAFLPAKPLIITLPMPAASETVTWEYCTRALAGQATALETIVLVKALTQQSAQDYHLESEADHPFLSFFKLDCVAQPQQYQAFVHALTVTEDDMRRNNDALGVNYHYLYPSEIPASTAI